MTIIAASIVRNEERFIAAMLESMQWVDRIVVVDDHSEDATRKVLENFKTRSKVPITVIDPWFAGTMLFERGSERDISREMGIRNHYLDKLFSDFNPDALVLVDGDELMSTLLREHIIQAKQDQYASVAITCNHLFSKNSYLHVYEQEWNKVRMVDPHVRVLFEKQHYQPGEWADVPDCFLKHSEETLCLDGPFHYHLKYLHSLNITNQSFKFMSRVVDPMQDKEYIKPLRHELPADISKILDKHF